METENKKISTSFNLAIISLMIVSISLISIVLNDWNVSPQMAHLVGLLSLACLAISVTGLIYFIIGIKGSKGFKYDTSGIISTAITVFILVLIIK